MENTPQSRLISRIKQSTLGTYAALLFIYGLATLAGSLLFLHTSGLPELPRLLCADLLGTFILWIFSLFFSNSSLYDPYWSVAPPVMVTLLAFYHGYLALSGILALAAIWFWAIRLTVNWIRTFPDMTQQDWRYVKFRKESPSKWQWQLINLGGIHVVPTLVVFAALCPVFQLASMPQADPNIFTILAFAVCVAAVILQGTADRQMRLFRKENLEGGKGCDTGLWRYSRHPNYLGEILFWWGLYGMMLSVAPHYWWLFVGPLSNHLLFLGISIPLMEKRQRERKPSYADYALKTGKLLPLRRKS